MMSFVIAAFRRNCAIGLSQNLSGCGSTTILPVMIPYLSNSMPENPQQSPSPNPYMPA